MLKFTEEKVFNTEVYKIEFEGYWGDCDLDCEEEDWVRRQGTKEEIEEIDKKIEKALRFWYDHNDYDDDNFRSKFSEILEELNIHIPYNGIYDREVDVLSCFSVTYYDENGKEYDVSVED